MNSANGTIDEFLARAQIELDALQKSLGVMP